MTVCNSGDQNLDAAVKGWLIRDKNPITRKEVEDDIKNEQWDKLSKTMLHRQKFGTAGLRGRMGAGYMCMNDVVVLQTAQGLCSYLKKQCNNDQLKHGVVVGYDGRHNSKRFAELTAKVFIVASIPVHIFDDVCPTPFVSFATMHYSAVAGIMVTASHNPRQDNGYKVYWRNGSQIISPDDDNILEEIWNCLDIPDEHWDIADIYSDKLVQLCSEEISLKYYEYIESTLASDVLQRNKEADVTCVYSAMHGVGDKFVAEAFKIANLKVPISVPQQRNPDPDFPTVKFPNPEEPECLELSKRLAEQNNVKLVIVNDPDADRLAVAEFNESERSWKVFSGNEMGALLGWWELQQYEKLGDEREVYVIASIVSSRMLKAIVKGKGHFVETLTGFKWIGNTTLLLQKQGNAVVFAFEEAIGYMCHPTVPDKDGVSAAVHVCSLASELYSSGKSLLDQLQELYKLYGFHVTHNSYYICNDPHTIQSIFRRIKNYHGPGKYPKEVGSCKVLSVSDLAAGIRTFHQPTHTAGDHDHSHLEVLGTGLDREYSGGEMVMFVCEANAATLRLTVRTSGTEPKIKYYTELVTDAITPQEQERKKKELESLVKEFIEELLQPKENGLIG